MPSLYSVAKTVAFAVFSPVCLFLVPKILDSKNYFHILSRVAAVTVLIGLPTAVSGSYSLLGYQVTPHIWGFNLPVPFIPNNSIKPITSVMDNPNVLGYLASVGFASSLFRVQKKSKIRLQLIVASINLLGAYLSGSRTALAVSLVVGVIAAVYYTLGPRIAWITALGTCTSVVYFLALNFELAPGPEALQADLRNRKYLWRATVQATEARPVLGFGAGRQSEFIKPFLSSGKEIHPPHNSYLRMFLTTGLLGGLTYIVLTGHVFARSLNRSPQPVLTCVVTAIILHQIFAGFSIFGLAFNSVIAAVSFGYVLRPE